MSTRVDTLQIANLLQNASFTKDQAEALAKVAQQIEDSNHDTMVTRDYLDARLASMEGKLATWLIGSTATIVGLLIATKIFV